MGSNDKFETFKDVFDEKTLLTLHKLEADGYFDSLKSPISIGKESNVFSACKKDGTYVCIKIYRINTADFKKMYEYIAADPRFHGLQKKRRRIIFAWAQREYRNLLTAYDSDISVPKPYAVKDNVLVMEFIGNKGIAAKRLKEKEPKDCKKFSLDLIKNLKRMYKIGLIHGDLSEFNILNHNEKPIIIDFSHSVKTSYPSAGSLLERDINNMQKYFTKHKMKIDIREVLRKIKNGIYI